MVSIEKDDGLSRMGFHVCKIRLAVISYSQCRQSKVGLTIFPKSQEGCEFGCYLLGHYCSV